MSAPTIRVVGATRRYGDLVAVDGASIEVRAGEVVGLLGANGAGKTTLIRMVLGLTLPTAGTVEVFGRPPSREGRRRIGYVPQHLGMYPDLTAAENLEFRADVYGVPATAADVHPPSLDGVDLAALVGDQPLGLQRRTAFAAALLHHPDLVILDEPTSGVSPLARSRLWQMIREEADRGAAVLVSTHYMDEAVQADRLVVMAHGRVVASGAIDDVIGDRIAMLIEAPRWDAVFAALDRAGLPIVLAGTTVRVPLADRSDAADVLAVLAAAAVQVDAAIVPATLDETMVELSR